MLLYYACSYSIDIWLFFYSIYTDVYSVVTDGKMKLIKCNIKDKKRRVKHWCWHTEDDIELLWLLYDNMGECRRIYSVIAVLVAVQIVLLVFTISQSHSHGRQLNGLTTSPSSLYLSAVDNDTVDEFLADYSQYCEKYLIPNADSIQQYSRKTPLCPCIPNDLGLFLHSIH